MTRYFLIRCDAARCRESMESTCPNTDPTPSAMTFSIMEGWITENDGWVRTGHLLGDRYEHFCPKHASKAESS